jgi:lipooligosaccharide transport system permease protein
MEHALRSYESFVLQYRRSWRGSIATSAITPLLYLTALGVGLGSFVSSSGNAPGSGSYLSFVAPGLLAATAMQIAAAESTYPVFAGVRWRGTYFAMLATPLRVQDILYGHQLFVATRVAVSSTLYLAVIAAFGAVHSPFALLAVPAALLLGVAVAAPCEAFAMVAKTDSAFATLFRFGIVPMFLFSGTFYPVSRLPEVLQWLAYVTPLWHGVELCRDLTTGQVDAAADLGHAAFLAVLATVGLLLALRTHRRRLVR